MAAEIMGEGKSISPLNDRMVTLSGQQGQAAMPKACTLDPISLAVNLAHGKELEMKTEVRIEYCAV